MAILFSFNALGVHSTLLPQEEAILTGKSNSFNCKDAVCFKKTALGIETTMRMTLGDIGRGEKVA